MDRVENLNFSEKLSKSYLNYSIAVITDRALPDYRDGLKPVARRILYAMYKMHIKKNTPHKKCARIVGEVLGKFHPHGDLSAYGALVRLARDFTLLHPLIEGQGSFGTIDDNAAAMRYTEARLESISELLLNDLEFNTVDFVDNFDSSLKEPTVLPARFPNLFLNGTSGIAVGMSTDIPSHNLKELIDGLVCLIENKNVGLKEILQSIKGPDFPTGGLIVFDNPKEELYTNGKGSFNIRAKIQELDVKRRNGLEITELPYNISKEKIQQQIIKLIKEKKLEGVLDLRDETDKEGIKLVLEFSRKVEFDKIVKILYKKTSLESNFKCQFYALDNGNPRLFNLEEYLKSFLNFRVQTTRRYFEFKLAEKRKRKNILEGFKKVIDNIAAIIKIIRSSNSNEEIRKRIAENFDLNQDQVNAIMEIRLSKLAKFEEDNIKKEIKELSNEIKSISKTLASDRKVLKYIKEDLLEIREKFGKKRMSKILK